MSFDGHKGENEFTISTDDINATGVIYYHFETADFSATKKMILLD